MMPGDVCMSGMSSEAAGLPDNVRHGKGCSKGIRGAGDCYLYQIYVDWHARLLPAICVTFN